MMPIRPGSTPPGRAQAVNPPPTRAEIGRRGGGREQGERHDEVIGLISPKLANFPKLDAADCRALYSYGRALFKKNRLGDAISALAPLGKACVGQDDDAGARAVRRPRRDHRRSAAARALQRLGRPGLPASRGARAGGLE